MNTTIHEILTGLERPVRFIFLRHGESEGNVEGKMQGHHDRLLTDRGRTQAAATARWFREHRIVVDRVYSSPLRRAWDTAAIVAADAGFPEPVPLNAAKEIDTGVFTDLTFPEIRQRYPTEYNEFVVGSWETVPGAESVASLTERALTLWRTIVDDVGRTGEDPSSGEETPPDDGTDRTEAATVLTVTHGGFLQWILKASFGATAADPVPWMPLVKAENCSLFVYHARPVRSRDRGGSPLRWYYGQWSQLNYVPAGTGEPNLALDEQFHSGGDQAR